MYGKRARQGIAPESFIPLSTAPAHPQSHNAMRYGTQHNPLEIDFSPGPQARHPPKAKYAPRARPNLPRDLRHAGLYVQRATPSLSKIKYYAVANGRVPGIYTDWPSTQKQVSGYPSARHKKFDTENEAWAFINANRHFVERAFQQKLDEASSQDECMSRQTPSSSPPPPYSSAPTPSWETSLQPAEDGPPSSPPEWISVQQNTAGSARFQDMPEDDYVPEPEPILTAEQRRVVDLIVDGQKNVFYTGSAGCGKSTILKAFVQKLKAQGKKVKIVAPTNLAALNVGGQTTWAYAGWTPDSMKKPLEQLKRSASGKQVWARFDQTDVLVIDEISMVENLQFERLNEIMKASLGNKNRGGGPFGGVQIVVTGDFCQLSPVKPFLYCIGCGWELIHEENDGELQHRCENRKCRYDVWPDADKWAFRSKAWAECNFEHVNLTEIHRQTDRKFIAILQKIRRDGMIVENHANLLLHHPSETKDAIKIFALRREVDRVNNENIAKLPSVARKYQCKDTFDWKEHHRDDLSLQKYTKQEYNGHTLWYLKEHRYEAYSQLKQGMRVVLQSNLNPEAGLVNGSQGVVVGFEDFDPNRLPRKAKRTESEDGGLKGEHAKYMESEIKAFAHVNNYQPWPIVQFDNGQRETIFADCSYSELGNEEKKKSDSQVQKECSLLSRTQIPLMAGYAITVHKSQGMTLDRVIVDLSDAFEASQIYVALSRARSLNGLKVVGIPRRNLGGANQQVKEFFNTYLDHTSPYSASLPTLVSQESHVQEARGVTALEQS